MKKQLNIYIIVLILLAYASFATSFGERFDLSSTTILQPNENEVPPQLLLNNTHTPNINLWSCTAFASVGMSPINANPKCDASSGYNLGSPVNDYSDTNDMSIGIFADFGQNYSLSNADIEFQGVQYCGGGGSRAIKTAFVLLDDDFNCKFGLDLTGRPIPYMRYAGSVQTCEETCSLATINGSGSGDFYDATTVNLRTALINISGLIDVCGIANVFNSIRYVGYVTVPSSCTDTGKSVLKLGLLNITNMESTNNTLPIVNLTYNRTEFSRNSTEEIIQFQFDLKTVDRENDIIYYSTRVENRSLRRNSFYESYEAFVDDDCLGNYQALSRQEFLTNCSFAGSFAGNFLCPTCQLDIPEYAVCENALRFQTAFGGVDYCPEIVYNFLSTVNHNSFGIIRLIQEHETNADFNLTYLDSLFNDLVNLEISVLTNLSVTINDTEVYNREIISNIDENYNDFFIRHWFDFENQTGVIEIDDELNPLNVSINLPTGTFKGVRFRNNNTVFAIDRIDMQFLESIPTFNWVTDKPNNISISTLLSRYTIYIYVTDQFHKDIPDFVQKFVKITFTPFDYWAGEEDFFEMDDSLDFVPPDDWSELKKIIWLLRLPRRWLVHYGNLETFQTALNAMLIIGMLAMFGVNLKNYGEYKVGLVLGAGGITSFILLIIGVFDIGDALAYIILALIYMAFEIKNNLSSQGVSNG